MEPRPRVRSGDGRDPDAPLPTVGAASGLTGSSALRRRTPAMSSTSRLAPLTGLLGIVLLVVGWFWDPAAPLDLPDDRLTAWYASHVNGPWLIAAALIALSGA